MIDLPFCQQKTDSACCGPCCLKMLADYYKCTKPDGKPYTKASLIQLCKTDKEYGTQFSDMRRVIKLLGLKMTKASNLATASFPVLACIPDEQDPDSDHYIVIYGYEKRDDGDNYLYAHDPYYGPTIYFAHMLASHIKKAGNWAWEIERA